jgi:uncharacterized protein YjiK
LRITRIALCAAIPAPLALGQITSLDLSNYQHTATFVLPSAASEASAVAFNPDTGNLYVLGDEGDALVEVTRAGESVSTMTLTGFEDTEGLTYVGNGQFVLVEERIQDGYRLTYTPGGTVDRASLPTASLGDTVGNVGLEGISFDPRNGRFLAVKEKTPQRVIDASIDFAAGSATVNDLFAPNLGLLDLSDVQVLATVPSLAGTSDEDNLLIYSQESARLLEATRAGAVLSQFDFTPFSASAEGVTIDAQGTIYLVDETPRLYVLTTVPEPSSAALILTGCIALSRRRGR